MMSNSTRMRLRFIRALRMLCAVNVRKVRELKLQYVATLIGVLKNISRIQRSDENSEAIRQIERGLVAILENHSEGGQKP